MPLWMKWFSNGKFLQLTLVYTRPLICFFHSIYSARYRGLTSDKAVFDKHIADLNVKLDAYDKILSKQKYIAGDVRPSLLIDYMNLPLITFYFL